ncbi:MAG: glucokinase [Gammaproteobacteria bacterium]|jgi:glucokinase|nr:glucokinase [Gammaproteobacteria bacterium]MBT5221328.1 glucokinase [Gammaproteobacteria bacterium]MBT5826162.1 glucokinase [Gammaproteobacteria bacterium]MBT6420116.1 glucokinase [Gammaproteobacteria bacterium]MBT6576579.1 glucokinase [Gammaproteobacteria bacterium]
MILAGDIGGTKTALALYSKNSRGKMQCEVEQTFASNDYPQFDDILELFLKANTPINAACFGIAGPIVDQRCQTTNLPWTIDARELSAKLGTNKVRLLNDLEAMAIGILNSPPTDLLELNPNAQTKNGNIAVIAAGTGLGQAILYWDGQQHQPMATEGGHTDFAPQTRQQDQFLSYLRKQFTDHVSWERVLCGDGFSQLYDFLLETGFAPACATVPSNRNNASGGDRNAIISRMGLNNEDPLCFEVVRLFAELYAAEAGNLALKCLSTGGVFIGGGIGPKIRPALEHADFLRAFTAKGRFKPLLSQMSIKLSLNPNTPLIGAANYFSA